MLSLWSALHPGVWVSQGNSEDGSFTLPPGDPVDVDTGMIKNSVNFKNRQLIPIFTSGLTPFWNAQTSFWASTAVVDTTPLGYSYPEFNGVDMGNADAVSAAIGNFVNQAYGSSMFGSFAALLPSSFSAAAPAAKKPVSSIPVHDRSHGPVVPPAPKSIPFHDHSHGPVVQPGQQHASSTGGANNPQKGHANPQNPPAQQHPVSSIPLGPGPAVIHPHPAPAPPSTEGPTDSPPNRGLWEWTARIEFKKYELGTSFSVLIFLGQVPQDPQDWRVSQNYVGGTHAFVNSVAAFCANCSNQQDVVQEGFVHLNHAIAKLSGLGSLEPNVVEPYLTDALQWRVQKVIFC